MKRKYLVIFITAMLAFLLAACGSASDTSSQEGSQGSSQEQTETTGDADTADAKEAVHPYAWLGLQDIPECHYLDVLSTNHYIKMSDEYIAGMSYVVRETYAVDGINTYKENDSSKVYSIDGRVISLNENSGSYMEQDVSDLAETAKKELASAMEKGTNRFGRSLKGTGSEAIPIYSEQGDTAEYEYYEYYYPETEANSDNSVLERFYLKDGDVFAIYTKTTMGETVVESTEVIDSISGDIPEGTFEIPDLSGYEKIEL